MLIIIPNLMSNQNLYTRLCHQASDGNNEIARTKQCREKEKKKTFCILKQLEVLQRTQEFDCFVRKKTQKKTKEKVHPRFRKQPFNFISARLLDILLCCLICRV
jgi:hypothetical protein